MGCDGRAFPGLPVLHEVASHHPAFDSSWFQGRLLTEPTGVMLPPTCFGRTGGAIAARDSSTALAGHICLPNPQQASQALQKRITPLGMLALQPPQAHISAGLAPHNFQSSLVNAGSVVWKRVHRQC